MATPFGDNMPNDPTYNEVTTRYEFVAWTETYDGGRPFLSTTVVNEDTVVLCTEGVEHNYKCFPVDSCHE